MKSNIKAITNIPGWLEQLEGAEKVTSALQAYSVPLIFRAVKLRCNSISRVPVYVKRRDKIVDWPFPTDLAHIIWQTEAGLLLSGMALWQRVTSPSGTVLKDLRWLNPFAIDIVIDRKTSEVTFRYNTSDGKKEYKPDQCVYIRSYNPGSEIDRGVSEADVAMDAAKLSRYMQQFAGAFFEGGAMPVTIVGVENAAPNDAERIQKFFSRLTTGLKNAFRVIGLSKSVDIKTITPPLRDLAFPALREQVIDNVAWAFGIPKTLLTSDSANYATADTEYTSYMQETVIPECDIISAQINKQLLAPLGYELVFAPEEMSMFQEDEEQRAGALVQLTQAGVPLDVAMAILGYDIPEGYTIDQLPDTQQQVRDELRAWMRKALKKGKDTPFTANSIPPVLYDAIRGSLSQTNNADSVRAVFEGAKTWEAYP